MEAGIKTDRRILRTKEAIHRAFVELFSEKEFERITINEIAERANVNRATVYLHFIDKYDLLHRCIEDHLNKMLLSCKFSKSVQEKITDPDETIESLRAVFVYFEDHYLFFSSMLSKQKTSIFRDCMLRIIRNTIQKQIDMQGINQSMDQELIINFTASAFVGTVEWWILNQMPHSPQAMAEQLVELFKRNNIF
jgi:AcrR family transcriptional regulator